jgi:hypothetical protein
MHKNVRGAVSGAGDTSSQAKTHVRHSEPLLQSKNN